MNNKLSDEILNIRYAMECIANSGMNPILQAYKRSLNKVREEIAKIYVRYAVNGELQISKQQRYTILKQIEKHLLEQAKELGHIDLSHTTKILEEIFQESFFMTAFIIESGIDIEINFSILKPEFIKAAIEMPIKGEMFSSRIWSNKTLLVNRLRDQIERGMIQGDSIDKMARRIKSEFGTSAYESKRLIHTEMARCMTQAQEEVYKSSGVVGRVLFDATLDIKTSEICRSYDGKMFDIGSNYPKPPLHPNCRSCIVPVVDGWSPSKKRENIKSDDGKKHIVDYQDYKAWAKSRGD